MAIAPATKLSGLEWNAPFLVFRSSLLSDSELAAESARYCHRLATFAAPEPLAEGLVRNTEYSDIGKLGTHPQYV